MVNVQHLVVKELEKSPVLIDVLQQDLANVSAVAVKLEPMISKELKRDVKISAVSMAVRRYIEQISEKQVFHWKFPKNLEVSTKSGIYEVAIERRPKILEKIKSVQDKVMKNKGDFLSIVEGTYEVVMFTNQSNKQHLKTALKNYKVTSELNNLTYVTVKWEKQTKNIPGIYYRITRALAFKGVTIQSFHTIGAEMMIFFKEDDFIEGYKTIMEIIKN